MTAFVCGMVTVPAEAHTYTTFYYHRWIADSDPKYWFHDSLPNTVDFRNRIRDAGSAWNAVGGPGAPDLIPQTVVSTGRNCSTGQNRVSYEGNLPSGVLAITLTCWYTTGLRQVYGFEIEISSDVSWYTGTGTPPSGAI